jgi:hypothetical protein
MVGGRIEKALERQISARHRADLRNQPDRVKRISAKLKEVILQPDGRKAGEALP